MPPKSSQKQPSNARAGPQGLHKAYLVAYNFLSGMLWFAVLSRVLTLGKLEGGFETGRVYDETEEFARLVQTGAVLEVVHSLVGLVRTPLLTTLMQVASRLLLVWGIGYNFPQTTRYSPAYSSMLVAWSVTEVVRYYHYVFALLGDGIPPLLAKVWTWLRYNTFLILYPIGVASETYLVYKAIEPAEKINPYYGYALWAILATYIPGFYTLFTYMLAQRRKVMRSLRTA